jgi:hypothetical protein
MGIMLFRHPRVGMPELCSKECCSCSTCWMRSRSQEWRHRDSSQLNSPIDFKSPSAERGLSALAQGSPSELQRDTNRAA